MNWALSSLHRLSLEITPIIPLSVVYWPIYVFKGQTIIWIERYKFYIRFHLILTFWDSRLLKLLNTCVNKVFLCISGSFNSVYALHSSIPPAYSSNLSAISGFPGDGLDKGDIIMGWLMRKVGWTRLGSSRADASLSSSLGTVSGAETGISFRVQISSRNLNNYWNLNITNCFITVIRNRLF